MVSLILHHIILFCYLHTCNILENVIEPNGIMSKAEHIFAPDGGYFVYCPSNVFLNMCSFENWKTLELNIQL